MVGYRLLHTLTKLKLVLKVILPQLILSLPTLALSLHKWAVTPILGLVLYAHTYG